MLTRLSTKSIEGIIWKAKQQNIQRDFQKMRKILSMKLGDPELNKISMKTFRHWKATMGYHRTKDILYVQRILGHKSLKNTLVYTYLLENDVDEAFTVKVASSIDEFT
jgi:integrase